MIVLIVWEKICGFLPGLENIWRPGKGVDRPQGTLGMCGEGMVHDHLGWRQLQLTLAVIGHEPHDSSLAYQSYTCLSGP
jgi:hypothetical protein